MKMKTLSVLAGAAAPMIMAGTATAEFQGLKWVKKGDLGFPNLVSEIVNVYAVFSDDDGDGIGDGTVQALAGLPGVVEANITVRDGVFYQHPAAEGGSRTAPSDIFVGIFPALATDTFLTIGWKIVPASMGVEDTTTLSPNFPTEDGMPQDGGTWSETRLNITDGSWFLNPPVGNPQGQPGGADNPDGQVLIGQFSIAAGAGPNSGVFGTMLIQYTNSKGGEVFQQIVSFDNQPAPGALAVLGTAGLLGCRRRRRR